jgi:Putative MetA-pathway of phenol degradation
MQRIVFAPPLVTEDTGTQGDGAWQAEVTVEQGRESRPGASYDGTETSFVLTRGFGEEVDLQLVVPYLRVTEDRATGRSVTKGMVDAHLNLKWRFYERKAFSLGVVPSLYLPTGADGISLGHVNAGARLIASYDTGAFEVHANAGARSLKSDFGLRDHQYMVSAAVAYTLHEKLKLVADQIWETNPEQGADASVRYTTLGAIWIVAAGTGLGCGVKLGHGEPAIDRTYICGLGIRR